MVPARRAFPQEVVVRLGAREGESLDAICGGRVRIVQRVEGYRFNLDPILLAHFAAETSAPRERIIDLGTGSGIIPLVLARKFGVRDLTALEVQGALHELAVRNVALNRCERRISVVRGDLRNVGQTFQHEGFDRVLCNPPYRTRDSGRLNPRAEKAIARHEVLCSLVDVARAAAHLLNDGGALDLVYPAARFARLCSVLRVSRLEPRRVRFVHARPSQHAKLVLVEAVKGSRAELAVLPPLVLHEAKGFTREVQQMLGPGDPRAGARRIG